jgi:hypothetical protein
MPRVSLPLHVPLLLGVQVAAVVSLIFPYCRIELGESQCFPAFCVRCLLMRDPWSPCPLVGSLCLDLMIFTVGGGCFMVLDAYTFYLLGLFVVVAELLDVYFLSGVCCRCEFGNVWSPAAKDLSSFLRVTSIYCRTAALLGLCLFRWGSLPMSRLYASLFHIDYSACLIWLPLGSFLGSYGVCSHYVSF